MSYENAFAAYVAKIGPAQAAKDLGITKSFVSMLSRGQATPGLKLALIIAKWSDGAVPCESWAKYL